MNLKDIDYVLALAQYGNFTKAANALYISQPALSKYIHNLEKTLDLPLFARLDNQVILTPAGKTYVAYAEKINKIRQELDVELKKIQESKKDKIHIGISSPAIASFHLSKLIPYFQKSYPDIRFVITTNPGDSIEQSILKGDIDLGIMPPPLESTDLTYEVISECYFIMVVPTNNPLIKHAVYKEGYPFPWIDIELFKNEDFILCIPSNRTRYLSDTLMKKAKITPKIVHLAEDSISAMQMSEMHMGISFSFSLLLEYLHYPQNVKVFLVGDPPIESGDVVVYRKEAILSPIEKEFIALLKR